MPKVVDHEERRREITYAVWYLIATRGFGAVTQRAVASEAGISVGRIQHYFSSKEEMIRYGCRALVETAASAFEERTFDVEPVEALRELVTRTIPQSENFRIGTTVWYAYLARSVDDPEIATILREAKRGEQEEAARLVRAARLIDRTGEGLEPEAIVRRLLSEADGLAMRVLIGELEASDAVEIIGREFDSLLSESP